MLCRNPDIESAGRRMSSAVLLVGHVGVLPSELTVGHTLSRIALSEPEPMTSTEP